MSTALLLKYSEFLCFKVMLVAYSLVSNEVSREIEELYAYDLHATHTLRIVKDVNIALQ